MTDAQESGGLALDAFDVIDEFVNKVAEGRLEENERSVHGSHPLVLLVESSLEAVTKEHLPRPIFGLTAESENALVAARRKLEDDNNKQPEFQLVLYSFEELCQVVREAGYSSSDPDQDRRFFRELFPEWLQQLTAWATAEHFEALAERVARARAAYVQIADAVTAR